MNQDHQGCGNPIGTKCNHTKGPTDDDTTLISERFMPLRCYVLIAFRWRNVDGD